MALASSEPVIASHKPDAKPPARLPAPAAAQTTDVRTLAAKRSRSVPQLLALAQSGHIAHLQATPPRSLYSSMAPAQRVFYAIKARRCGVVGAALADRALCPPPRLLLRLDAAVSDSAINMYQRWTRSPGLMPIELDHWTHTACALIGAGSCRHIP